MNLQLLFGAFVDMWYGSLWFWFLMMIVVMVIAFSVQGKVVSTMKKYSQVDSKTGLNGTQVSAKVLAKRGNTSVRYISGKKSLGDNYNPRDNTITLSPGVGDSQTVASIAVALHETGHAMQYHDKSIFIRIRNIVLPFMQILQPICSAAFSIGFMFLFFGWIFGGSSFGGPSDFVFWALIIGVSGYVLTLIFQLVTIPVELNASKRALKYMVEDGFVTKGSVEYQGAKECLNAAAMTYVVAALMTLVQLIYWIIILLNMRNRRQGPRGRGRR